MNFFNKISFNDDGLVCAIAQDFHSRRVLMQAWMSRESLQMSIEEGRAIYFSRSRQKIWRKGEESGNVQHLIEIRLDCDGDCLLLLVEQQGGIACHTGRESCFYRVLNPKNDWVDTDPVLIPSEALYGRS